MIKKLKKKTIEQINEIRNWFFEKKINKINKSLARLIKRVREKGLKQNHKWDRRNNNQHYRNTVVREYYKNLYANKLDNLEKMDKLLQTYNLPKLKQEEIENLNRQITTKETE